MLLRSIELQSSQGAIKTAFVPAPFVFVVLDELDVSHEALSKPAKRLEDVISRVDLWRQTNERYKCFCNGDAVCYSININL